MNPMQLYSFNGQSIRVIQRDGNPWWIAADVCAALGLANTSKALDALDADEKGITSSDTLGGAQQVCIVNEAGLYSLIFRSRKAIAQHFRRWVTHEVLPSIRKTGAYSTQPSAAAPALPFEAARQHVISIFEDLVKRGCKPEHAALTARVVVAAVCTGNQREPVLELNEFKNNAAVIKHAAAR